MVKINNDQTPKSLSIKSQNLDKSDKSSVGVAKSEGGLKVTTKDSLSSQALNLLKTTLKESAEADQKMVANIKSKIESKDHKIDLEKLAQNIINRSLIEDF